MGKVAGGAYLVGGSDGSSGGGCCVPDFHILAGPFWYVVVGVAFAAIAGTGLMGIA